MGKKKGKYISIIPIVILIILIPMVAYNYFGQGRKEIGIANKFIKRLTEKNIIEKSSKEIKFKLKEKSGTEKEEGIYSLVSDDYRVDLDKNKNIISFIYNNKNSKKVNITPEKAKELAMKYVDEMFEGEYKIDEISKEDKDSNSYYSVVFSKYEDGYPYYLEKLIMNINKEDGKLQGCINKTQNLSHKKIDINISEKEAEEIALNSFNKLNKDGKIINKPYLAFYNNKEDEGENELCYIIEIANKSEKNVYFISSINGDVKNSFSNIIEKTKVK